MGTDEIRYLSVDEVAMINAMELKRCNSKNNGNEQILIRDKNLLDVSVNKPKLSLHGEEIYPSIEEKAAAIYISLIKNHCFANGNKRTAHLSMIMFLKLNGYDSNLSKDKELSIQIALDIITEEMNHDRLVLIIKESIE